MRFKLIEIDVKRYPVAPQNFIYHSLRRVVERLSVKEILYDVYTTHTHNLHANLTLHSNSNPN